MQDRYSGDIGDYGKFGLLRVLTKQGLRIGINWYKVDPPDYERNAEGAYKQNDGKYRHYEEYSSCDSDLAAALMGIPDDERSIATLQGKDLIKDATYYDEPVPADNEKRQEWFDASVKSLDSSDIIFMDPDNGLEVKSVHKGSPKSIKYVYYREVETYLIKGKSVVIYNHRCRKKREVYFTDIIGKLLEHSKQARENIFVITFNRYSVRDYFVIALPEHRDRIEKAITEMAEGSWKEMCYLPDEDHSWEQQKSSHEKGSRS